GPRPNPRRWLKEAGLATASYRFLLRHLPERLSRDIRLVHQRVVDSGRARWLGEEASAGPRPPLADLDRAVERVRALLADAAPAAVPALDRAA
ncbi:MAG TPA: hypothetical protein VF606_13410, partial [Geminicoccaceae bacterium]